MFKTFVILCGLVAFGFVGEAQAQWPCVPYGYGGFTYRHSSTAAEGWYRGQGAYLRGYGEYVRSRAEAAAVYEQARQHRIENWKRYVQTRQELKDAYKARREAHWAEKRAKLHAYLERKKSK